MIEILLATVHNIILHGIETVHRLMELFTDIDDAIG